jgi:hypothetical protein
MEEAGWEVRILELSGNPKYKYDIKYQVAPRTWARTVPLIL